MCLVARQDWAWRREILLMVKIAAERGAKVTNKDYTGACWVGRHTYAADKCGLKPFLLGFYAVYV